MRSFLRHVAIVVAIGTGTAAYAQDAAPASSTAAAPAASAVKRGDKLSTADGRRLGRVERVVPGNDGAILRVSVIFDGRIVYLPGNTLTATEGGVTTSLTIAEVRKLRK